MPGDQDPTGAGMPRVHLGGLEGADNRLVDAIGLVEQSRRDQDIEALTAAVSANQSVLADLLFWAMEASAALEALGVDVDPSRPGHDVD